MKNSHPNSLNLILNSDIEHQLKEAARQAQKNEQEIIIEALEEHLKKLKKSPSCYTLALELGVIGIAKDLPADLSTNPDYLQGFGQ
jgi:hypothetical protein